MFFFNLLIVITRSVLINHMEKNLGQLRAIFFCAKVQLRPPSQKFCQGSNFSSTLFSGEEILSLRYAPIVGIFRAKDTAVRKVDTNTLRNRYATSPRILGR